MGDEKKLNELSIDELVHLILDEPDRMDEIFRSTDDLQELYEALENEIYPHGAVLDDAEVYTNSVIEEALEKLSRAYLYEEADYDLDLFEGQPEITMADLREADEELEEFYSEHPEMDDRPDSPIPEGMSVEEYSEAMGIYINEFGEIIRPQNSIEQDEELMAWLNGSEVSPLKMREVELSKLEKEAKTISEAETLIDKQAQKTGEQK